MGKIFNNEYYLLKILSLIIVILLTCFYADMKIERLTFQECLANPEKFDNSELKFGSDWITGKVEKDWFELVKGDERIIVKGNVDGLKQGDFIDLVAVFHKEGYVELKEAYLRKMRRVKIVLSLLAVLLVTYLFFNNYRFDFTKRGFVER